MNCPRCDKPIDEHEAGRETDACVAFAVMGFNHHQPIPMPAGGVAPADAEIVIPESDDSFKVAWGTRSIGGTYPFFDGEYLWTGKGFGKIWSPSTKIAAAWEAVEQLANDDWIISVGWGNGRDGRKYASVQMSVDLFLEADLLNRPITQMDGRALTAPLAICRAALKAVYVGEDEGDA